MMGDVNVLHAPLGTARGITNGVDEARKGPASTERSGGYGEPKTRDEKSSEEGDLVLGEVGVSTLGWEEREALVDAQENSRNGGVCSRGLSKSVPQLKR